MVDPVAKALCRAAGASGTCKPDQAPGPTCVMCDHLPDGRVVCTFWPSFRGEAAEAIRAAYLWHKEHRRWPGWLK